MCSTIYISIYTFLDNFFLMQEEKEQERWLRLCGYIGPPQKEKWESGPRIEKVMKCLYGHRNFATSRHRETFSVPPPPKIPMRYICFKGAAANGGFREGLEASYLLQGSCLVFYRIDPKAESRIQFSANRQLMSGSCLAVCNDKRPHEA